MAMSPRSKRPLTRLPRRAPSRRSWSGGASSDLGRRLDWAWTPHGGTGVLSALAASARTPANRARSPAPRTAKRAQTGHPHRQTPASVRMTASRLLAARRRDGRQGRPRLASRSSNARGAGGAGLRSAARRPLPRGRRTRRDPGVHGHARAPKEGPHRINVSPATGRGRGAAYTRRHDLPGLRRRHARGHLRRSSGPSGGHRYPRRVQRHLVRRHGEPPAHAGLDADAVQADGRGGRRGAPVRWPPARPVRVARPS